MTLPPPKIASSPASGPGPPQRSSVTSISRSVSASRTRSPVVGPYSAAYRARRYLSHRAAPLFDAQPGHDPGPASATSVTVRDTPGSNRTDVPAGMSSR